MVNKNFSFSEVITPFTDSPSRIKIRYSFFEKETPPASVIDFLMLDIIPGSLSVPKMGMSFIQDIFIRTMKAEKFKNPFIVSSFLRTWYIASHPKKYRRHPLQNSNCCRDQLSVRGLSWQYPFFAKKHLFPFQ